MPRLSSLTWRFPQKPISGPPAQTPVSLMGRVKGMMVCFSFFRENRVGLNNRDTLSMVTKSARAPKVTIPLHNSTQLYGGKMKQTSKYQKCTCGRLQRLCLLPQIPVLKCPTLNKGEKKKQKNKTCSHADTKKEKKGLVTGVPASAHSMVVQS